MKNPSLGLLKRILTEIQKILEELIIWKRATAKRVKFFFTID